MQGVSPAQTPPGSGRPPSTPKRQGNDFYRMTSNRSLTTPRRMAMELAQSQANAMRVYVRVRPFSQRELSLNLPTHSTVRIDVENPSLITLLDPQKDFRPRETFCFNRCLWSVLEHEGGAGETANLTGEMRSFMENSVNNITSSRGARSQGMSSVSLPTPVPLSARNKAGAENSFSFEGAGSSAMFTPGFAVPHPPYSSQQDVYNEVGRPVLENALEGYNGCVFAYGQTGSGKTFTMFGVAPTSVEFLSIARRHNTTGNGDDDYDEDDDYDDDDDDCEDSKMSLSSVSPSRMGRNSPQRCQTSQQDVSARRRRKKNGEQVVDIVDTTKFDPQELQGIIPRICSELFKGLREKRDEDASHSYRVEVEYYEIYNEKVYDLISSEKGVDLKIRQNPATGPFVEGLISKVVKNEDQIAAVIAKGSSGRHTSATKRNDRSSRSHAILTMNIMQLYLDQSDNTHKKQSKLNLVDLAGSERTGAVGAEGKQFKEGTKINLSLTTLGRVIDCLADLSQSKTLSVPVPYRDSKLTWLLMDSLGGNSRTSMVATISPHCVNFEEMKQTIRYASRAKQIVNKAVINEDPQLRQIRQLTHEVERLKKIIRDAGHNEFERDYVLELQRRVAYLEKRCEEQEITIVELRAELEGHGITLRNDDSSRIVSARRPHNNKAQLRELSVSRRRDTSEDDGGDVAALKSQLTKARSEVEELSRRLHEEETQKRVEACNNTTQVQELNGRIKNLKKEIEKMQKFNAKRDRQIERFSFFYVDWASDIMRNTMIQKEEEFIRQVSFLTISQNDKVGDGLRRMQKLHREEMEQERKRHADEMDELHKVSATRLKESIEKSNELYQQLVDKHMDKLGYVEERMKKNKDFFDAEQKRAAEEKEAMRAGFEEQLNKARTQHQEETRRLREQMNSATTDRQRSGKAVKRLQEDHEKEISRRQEEMDRYRRDREHEISRLKQVIENYRMRRESDIAEKERQRRALESEVNELRREMLKLQTERNRMEQEHHAEMQSLAQQQERLVSVSNGLLADWDSRSSAMDTSFSQLRALLHSQEYINFRTRLREATLERKDYTAELEAVEERKRRDTQRLREIVQQLRQNQEDSKASIQRFEEDVMKHLSRSNKARRSGNSSGADSLNNSGNMTSNGKPDLKAADSAETPPPGRRTLTPTSAQNIMKKSSVTESSR